VLVVEGDSDRGALEMLAARLGRSLEAEGVALLPLGGATNLVTSCMRWLVPTLTYASPDCATRTSRGRSVGISKLQDWVKISTETAWRSSGSSWATPTWRTS
jgi:hypothetical protein